MKQTRGTYEQYKRAKKPDTCLNCGREVTWAERRRQFGSAMRAGLTVEEVKALGRMCAKCMTLAFEARRRQSV